MNIRHRQMIRALRQSMNRPVKMMYCSNCGEKMDGGPGDAHD